MAYEEYCASCTYMKDKVDCGKYFCERKGEWRYADDAKCYNWCEAYSRSGYSRENMYNNSASSGSSCYLTTIMCQILGYPDNNYYLNTLRTFRDDVMKKDPKYIPMLITYDVYGPLIAERIAKDENNQEIANGMLCNYIDKAVGAIEEEKYDVAIEIYTAMTEVLAESYGIEILNKEVDINTIDINTLGHAKIRSLIPKKEI